ncbi:radical SAM protein [bacterium]|nr:radical SAM protein [bacterium]
MFFNKKELMPERVKLGVCSICNLNCRDCYMRKSKTNFGNVGAGYLKYENFVKFLDMNPFVREIELANHGEAFLNPDLVKILETACKRNIIITFNNGVNFNRVSDAQMEALVKYSVRGITVAIDGGSSDVYVKYRRGGNFDTVISNIKKLNEYKKKYNSEFPILSWQYVVMDTNDSKEEVDKAVKLANDLNMEIFFIRTWNLDYKPKDPDFVNSILIDVRDTFKDYKNLKKEPICSVCTDLWEAPQINWDGRFLACCCNYLNPFDINVFETGLTKCLKSKMIRKTKKMLMGGKPYKKSPCYNCWFYKKVMMEKDD